MKQVEVLASIAIGFFASVYASDPCAVLGRAPGNLATVSAVRACLESIPFDEDVRDATLTAAEKTLALYTFKDTSIQWNTPPFEINVDLPKELKKLRSQGFENDYEFHTSLYSLMLSLNDAHTRYISRCHHSAFTVFQPLVLSSVGDGDEQIIKVKELVFPDDPEFSSFWNVDLKRFENAVVVKIDGESAMDYLYKWSSTYVFL